MKRSTARGSAAARAACWAKPVEGWRRARINGLLEETGNLPLKGYISSDIPAAVREKYGVRDDQHAYGAEKTGWINNVACMPEDDDTNYTLLALKLVEQYGRGFTPDDAAENWLMNLPLLHTCTAERAAYINLAQSVYPPQSAVWRNPYREWIGAQIRGDLFGYICPGDMETAAEMGVARRFDLPREERHLRRNVGFGDAREGRGLRRSARDRRVRHAADPAGEPTPCGAF